MSHNIAFVREQGMNLVVVCMADHVVEGSQAEDTWRAMQARYGVPTALVGAQRHRIYGDRRVTGWLGSIDLGRLPWRRAA